jgi:large subunit ribosomal protein L35
MRIPSRLLARSLSTTAPTPSSSSAYTPPLAPGVLPAYDQALLYLSSDRTTKLESLEKLRAAAGSVGAGEGQAEAWEKRKEMEKLEVDAWVNDPETRWRSERGLGE